VSTNPRPSKAERREVAREKARAMREAAEAKERRQKRLLVVVAVVAVLAVIVGVGAIVQSSRSNVSKTAATPSNFVDNGIVTGDANAPAKVSVYLDYQCPACAAFEHQNGAWLEGLRDEGKIALEFKPIAILDRFSSTKYSTRSANAAACVADTAPDAFTKFNDALFVAQPAEGGDGLPDSELVSIAKQAGAPDTVEKCITDGQFEKWVATATDQSSKDGVQGTPTVMVNDKIVESSREAIQQAVDAAS
jgi:protein-disulfide isomerase